MSSLTKDNLNELEARARLNAEKEISDLFQKFDELDKIEQVKTRYQRMKSAKETQLKTAVHSQLDGVRQGLQKLDSAMSESLKINSRMEEMSTCLKHLDGLSSELGDLQALCNRHNQLAAAMENMAHIVKVPDTVSQARQHIASENILEGHKLIQELEGTRDELMFEVYRANPKSPDLDLLRTYFKDLPGLNRDLLSQIKMLATRITSAVICRNVYVVNILRVVDREERADEIWLKRNASTNFMPMERPKCWKRQFFDKMFEMIKQRVMECALDDDDHKDRLVRHNELIRQHTVADLKIARTVCPIYFPKDYRIYDAFVEMYHNSIGEYVEKLLTEELSDTQVVQLLGWINEYHSDSFMGSKELDIHLERLNINYPGGLLPEHKLDALRERYLLTTATRLRSWMSKSITTDVRDWHRQQVPDRDGSANYFTTLPVILLSPIMEMVGDNNLLQYIGNQVKVKFFEMFIEELGNFTVLYKNEIKQFAAEYFQDRTKYPAFIEYILANANNCLAITSSFETTLDQEFKNNLSAKNRLEKEMERTNAKYTDLINECLRIAEQVVLKDLENTFRKIMTSEWILPEDNTAYLLTGTMEDYYNTSIVHLKMSLQAPLISKIAQKMCVDYIKALLTRRLNFTSIEERRRVGQKIDDEGKKLKRYFEKLPIAKSDLEAFDAICMIAQILINNDISMLSLEILNMERRFSHLRKEQVTTMLLLRGDLKSRDAQDYTIDWKVNEDPSKNPIFAKVTSAMS